MTSGIWSAITLVRIISDISVFLLTVLLNHRSLAFAACWLQKLCFWDRQLKTPVVFFFQLPFPIIGSLNGVHMFASTHGVKLIATTTDTAKVVWKVYNNRYVQSNIGENDLL